jgi:DNA-directed RNA polymerase beta' subunit
MYIARTRHARARTSTYTRTKILCMCILFCADYGRERASVRHRFASTKSKHGRVRGCLLGKRGDFNARGVASPNTNIDCDEVGLPISVCKNVPYAETVHALNFDKILLLVRNGPDIYPGANLIKRGLDYFSCNGCFGGLRIGDIVYRHLQKGDLVIVNRQPSLHRYSLMAFRVVPTHVSTIQMHLAVTNPLNLDFDGDEVNVFILFDVVSRAEAQELMAVGKNMWKDGKLIVCFVQHACLGAFLMTKENIVLDRKKVFWLAMISKNEILLQNVIEKVGDRTEVDGREFFSWMLPCYKPAIHKTVDKKLLNYLMSLMARHRWAKSNLAVKFMSAIGRVLEEYATTSGCSMSLECCTVNIPETMNNEVKEMRKKINQLTLSAQNTRDITSVQTNDVEDKVCSMLDTIRDYLGDFVLKDLRSRSRCDLLSIVESGAKGNLTHITQNAACVGSQLDVYSKRPLRYPNIETADELSSKGFVLSCFVDGLTSIESFHHMAASRVGLVGTAVTTAETGYCYRRISKCLEDLRVSFDNSVRDAHGNVVLFNFGFDTEMLVTYEIRFLEKSRAEIVEFYRTEDVGGVEEVDHILKIRSDIFCKKEITRKVSIPLSFEQMEDILNDDGFSGPAISNETIRNVVLASWTRLVTEYFIGNDVYLKALFFDRLSTRSLRALGVFCLPQLLCVMKFVAVKLSQSILASNTPIGLIVSQSFSEPLTQMNLNRFHHSGEASELTGGVARIKELLNLTKQIATPSMEIFIRPNHEINPLDIVQLRLREIVTGWTDRCIDKEREEDFRKRLNGPEITDEDVRVVCFLDRQRLINRRISPRIVSAHFLGLPYFSIDKEIAKYTSFSNIASEEWWIAVCLPKRSPILKPQLSKEMNSLNIYHAITIDKRLLAGISGIRTFFSKNVEIDKVVGDELIRVKRQVIVTLGTNLSGICEIKGVDRHRTTSNEIMEIYHTLGIDAAQKALENQLVSVMLSNAAEVKRIHIKVLCASMCSTGVPRALTYSGLVHAKASALKLSLFERSLNSFITASVNGHKDGLRGVSESTMAGSKVSVGTGGDFSVISTNDKVRNQAKISRNNYEVTQKIPSTMSSSSTADADVAIQNIINDFICKSSSSSNDTTITTTNRNNTSASAIERKKNAAINAAVKAAAAVAAAAAAAAALLAKNIEKAAKKEAKKRKKSTATASKKTNAAAAAADATSTITTSTTTSTTKTSKKPSSSSRTSVLLDWATLTETNEDEIKEFGVWKSSTMPCFIPSSPQPNPFLMNEVAAPCVVTDSSISFDHSFEPSSPLAITINVDADPDVDVDAIVDAAVLV